MDAEGSPSSLFLGPSGLVRRDFRASSSLTWACVPSVPWDVPCDLIFQGVSSASDMPPRPTGRLHLRSLTWVRSALSLLWASVPQTFIPPPRCLGQL